MTAEAARHAGNTFDGQAGAPAWRGHKTLFRLEVLKFLRDAQQRGRVVSLQPLSVRIVVWGMFAATAGATTLLCLVPYARQEIVTGYLTPVSETARVFAPQPGTVSIVHVRNDDTVEKGQPLLTVATDRIAAGGEDINASTLKALKDRKLTLVRTIADDVNRMEAERKHLAGHIQDHENLLIQLNSELATQQKRVAILASLDDAHAQLRVKGLGSEIDEKHHREALLDAQLTLLKLVLKSANRSSELSEFRSKLDQLPVTLDDRIQSSCDELSATEQRIAEIDGRGEYTIRAPIAGRVSRLQATVGSSVDPKRLQLQIIPGNSRLQAELFVPVRAIGFVEVGQDVSLQFDAFPHQRVGSYHGRITTVSRTVLLPSDVDVPVSPREPAYAATVTLDRPDVDADGKKEPLQPDMSLRADIILKKRTLMDWLLEPLRYPRIEG
jgi:membrane fusion protein